jgi:hypothetical protein
MSVQATLFNANGDPVLFTGATDNKLVLTIANTGSAALSLTAGTPVPENETATATQLSLAFGKLLQSTSADPGLTVTAVSGPAWASLWDATNGYLCLAPQQDFQLPPGESVALAITGWPVYAPGNPNARVDVEWSNIGTDDGWMYFAIMVHGAPSATPHPLVLDLEFAGGESLSDKVYVFAPGATPIQNELVLRVVNTNIKPIVPSGTSAAGAQFRLLFPCGPTPTGATLTTADRAVEMSVSPTAPFAGTWTVGPPDVETNPPSWLLAPQLPEIIGASSGVEFELSGLAVPEPIGFGVLYLQHTGVPGFDDGYQAVTVEKVEPTPGILSFHCLSSMTPPVDTPIVLAWTTFDVTKVDLTIAGPGTPQSFPGLPSPQTAYQAPPISLPGTVVLNLSPAGQPSDTTPLTIVVYSTAVQLGKPTVAGTTAQLTVTGPELDVSWTAINATSSSIALGENTVALDVVDGQVTCQLMAYEGDALTVLQNTVLKGQLPLSGASGETHLVVGATNGTDSQTEELIVELPTLTLDQFDVTFTKPSTLTATWSMSNAIEPTLHMWTQKGNTQDIDFPVIGVGPSMNYNFPAPVQKGLTYYFQLQAYGFGPGVNVTKTYP